MPLKQFITQEALRLNVTPECVRQRLHRGSYKHVKLHKVNKRVIYVLEER